LWSNLSSYSTCRSLAGGIRRQVLTAVSLSNRRCGHLFSDYPAVHLISVFWFFRRAISSRPYNFPLLMPTHFFGGVIPDGRVFEVVWPERPGPALMGRTGYIIHDGFPSFFSRKMQSLVDGCSMIVVRVPNFSDSCLADVPVNPQKTGDKYHSSLVTQMKPSSGPLQQFAAFMALKCRPAAYQGCFLLVGVLINCSSYSG